MNEAVIRMLERYTDSSADAKQQALREILQEIALVGLWRGKFFEHAAFYGGTALRILYGLDRFSEHIDFTLLKPNPKFSWDNYSKFVTEEIKSYGFEISMQEKKKKNDTAVKSAFLKANTVQELIKIGVKQDSLHGIHPQSTLRIKVEIDTSPPTYFDTEHKILREPSPVSIRCVNLEGLFVGKMHAALFREWKGRVKGRDWYDLVWYIRKGVPLNLELFSKIAGIPSLSKSEFFEMIKNKIENLDIPSAVNDILVFVSDHELIKREWSKSYFYNWIGSIEFK